MILGLVACGDDAPDPAAERAPHAVRLLADKRVEGLPPRHDDQGHRPDDGLVGAERDPHGRPRRDGGGRGQDPEVLAHEVGRLRPLDPLNRITPRTSSEYAVAGDRGTLHFECHYVDYDNSHVDVATVADLDVAPDSKQGAG